VPLSASFRSAYAYDNVLYTVAGELIAAVSGLSWEQFVRERILAPLDMKFSNVYHSHAGTGDNSAAPHGLINDTLKKINAFGSDNTNPAGGINSCALDMAKWLRVQLDSGRIDESRRLFSPATAEQLWNIVTPIAPLAGEPELIPARCNFSGYALGFRVCDYRGEKMVHHTGGLPGFLSRVAMIPRIKLGIAVLTNQESSDAYNAIIHTLLDYYLAAPRHDWLGAYRSVKARNDSTSHQKTAVQSAARDSLSHPSLSLESYCGTYRDRWYGDIAIDQDSGKLQIKFLPTPALVGDLTHWQYDTFIVRWHDPELRADAFITFYLDARGRITEAKMAPVSDDIDFSFDFQDLNRSTHKGVVKGSRLANRNFQALTPLIRAGKDRKEADPVAMAFRRDWFVAYQSIVPAIIVKHHTK